MSRYNLPSTIRLLAAAFEIYYNEYKEPNRRCIMKTLVFPKSLSLLITSVAFLTMANLMAQVQVFVQFDNAYSGATMTVDVGTTFDVSADEIISGTFVKWEATKGVATIEDPNAESTSVTAYSNVTITAVGSNSPLSIEMLTATGGVTEPSGTIKADGTQEIVAIPDDGYMFIKWEVTEGDATVANEYSANTILTTKNSDSKVQAVFAVEDSTTKAKFLVNVDHDNKNKGNSPNKDKILIKKMPASFESFDASTAVVKVVVDGNVFTASDKGSDKKGKITYKKFENEAVKNVKGSLIIDTKKGEWSFNANNLYLENVINDNGIDMVLMIDDNTYGANEILEEKTQWKFNENKNDQEAIDTDFPDNQLEGFVVEKGTGKYEGKKGSQDFLITNATLSDSTIDFGEDTQVAIILGERVITIDGPFTSKGTHFQYKDKSIDLKIDPGNNSWQFKLKKDKGTQIEFNNPDGLPVYLLIGAEGDQVNYQGAVNILGSYKSMYK